jgi:hypothetical protein
MLIEIEKSDRSQILASLVVSEFPFLGVVAALGTQSRSDSTYCLMVWQLLNKLRIVARLVGMRGEGWDGGGSKKCRSFLRSAMVDGLKKTVAVWVNRKRERT